MSEATALGRLRGMLRRVTLRDLLFFTGPPVLLLLYVYVAALGRTQQTLSWDDWWSRDKTLYHHFGYQTGRGAPGALTALELERTMDPERPDAGVVRVDVNRAEWDTIGRDPQSAFGRYFDASLLEGGALRPVRLRVRGDTSAHWSGEKHSFTLRAPKTDLYRGFRRLAFNVKYVLPQFLTARLAQDFGLLAPDVNLSAVFLNDRFYGVYRVMESPGEEFLRRHERLPGNVYRGDTAERGEVFLGIERSLFRNPYIWDTVAEDGRSPERARTRLRELLADLHETTPAGRQRLLSQFDRDEISRLFAYLFVAGDLYHLSELHNQFWYEDPTDGVLHPVPWDVYLRPLDRESGVAMNTLFATLIREPAILEGALRIAAAEYDAGLIDRLGTLLEEQYARRSAAFEYDRLRKGAIPKVGSSGEVLALLRSNEETLRTWTRECRVAFGHGDADEQGRTVLDLATRSLAGADLTALQIDGGVADTEGVQLILDRNRDGRPDESDPVVAGRFEARPGGGRFVPDRPIALLGGASDLSPPFAPDALHYRLFLRVRTAGPLTVRPELVSRLTGETAEVLPWRAGERIVESRAWHPWAALVPTPRETRLAGDVLLSETLVVAPADRLVIEPGATLRLAAGVSLIARGRVVAEGTPERPITFEPATAGEPWGVLALQGHGTDGSTLRHCRISGGSGAEHGSVAYSGMVSVRGADHVVFADCEIRDNHFYDDAFHAVHAPVELLRCRFAGANSDAVDFDYSAGTIRDCVFENSGNDAIDLMTSHAVIVGNSIANSGDKGISVGEASRPLVFDNVITGCAIGVEVKDASEPFLVHNEITGNQTGVRQGRKNWRYGEGGFGRLVHTRVSGNGIDLEGDGVSRWISIDSLVVSVVGADVEPRPEAPAADTVCECLLARLGVAAPRDHGPPGRLAEWSSQTSLVPVVARGFRADFESVTDGWESVGEVLWLRKRGRDLVAALAGEGGAALTVDWDLADPKRRYVALFEIRAENASAVEVVVAGDDGEQSVRDTRTFDAGEYALLAVPLPAGRYTDVRVTATTAERRARLRLHALTLYSLPPTED